MNIFNGFKKLTLINNLNVTVLSLCLFLFSQQAQSSENILGEAKHFNAYIFGNFFADDSNVAGGLAVGGNLKLESYSVSSAGQLSSTEYALLIEGNASFDNGNVVSGLIRVAGDMSDITDSVLASLPEGVSVENQDLAYSIKDSKSYYQELSASLTELSVNGSVENKYGGLYLNGDCESSLQVFNLLGSEVDSAHTFEIKCVPNNATVIFNISGDNIEFESKGLSTLTPHRDKIIFNFYQAKDIKLSSITIEGSILAPNAEIIASDGQMMGTVIADRWQGSMSLGHAPFMGTISSDDNNENKAPVAEDITLEVDEDSSITFQLTASDLDDDELAYIIVSTVSHGELSGTAPNLKYTPTPDYFGSDSFTFKVNDGQADSVIATVTINVNDVPEPDNILSVAQKFNAFVFGNFFADDSNSSGGLAVGGNLKLESYSASSAGIVSANEYAILVEGNASFDNGNVVSGLVRVAGDMSDITDSVLASLPEGVSVENTALDYSIKEKQEYFENVADSLAGLTANGTVENKYGGLYLSGDCESSLQVFNLVGSIVDAAHTFEIKCIPNNATVIFNISGDEIEFESKGLSTLTPHRDRIIFNFYEATKLKLSSITIEGSILAPTAEISASDGQLMGTVIAERWDGSMSLGYVPFVGSVVPVSNVPDSDGDGVNDNVDAFPNDSSEWMDSDSDGVGDNADVFPNDATETTDSDGDGVGDNADVFPNDATESADTDGDGVGDNADAFPNDATEASDLDGDGIGNNSDPDIDGDNFTNVQEEQALTDPYNNNDYPDTVSPSIQLNNTGSIDIESEFFTLNGIVTDTEQPYSGVASVIVESERYPETSFTGTYDNQNNTFSIEVPLKALENVITVTALDDSGNVATATLTINREPAPTLINITPVNGTLTTQPTTTISGEIHSILPVSALSFWINDWQVTPTSTDEANVYQFTFPEVNLAYGANTFNLVAVSTNNKTHQVSIVINYTAENADSILPPLLTLNSPSNGALLNQETFSVSAVVESYGGPLTVQVDNNVVLEASSSKTEYIVNELVTFNGSDSSTTVSISALDSLGKTTTQEYTFYRDVSAPVIILDTPLSDDAVNTITDSPYLLTGTISDDNLASVLINEQPVTLLPGSTENTYTFSISVPVTSQETLPINISAYDRSGNHNQIEYILENIATATIEPLLPAANAEYVNQGEPIIAQVLARVDGVTGNETATVQYQVNSELSAAENLNINGSLASGSITLPAATGDFTIVISLYNANSELITKSDIKGSITSVTDVPIEIVRQEPINNSKFIEPNTPIEIYFNREIDISLLSVQVRETLHGKDYENTDGLGADFINAQGYQLVDVHRDLSLVSGVLELSPGATSVAFYANKMLGFNASVYVDVTYNGEELSRSFFKVRELPTFINGAVADQFGQPLSGVTVEIPELDRKTTTNGDGGFAFGYQETGENIIPAGQYSLLINSDFTAPYMGMVTTKINIQRNYTNQLQRYTLQELNRDVAFQTISSGQVNNLVGGDLQLDLTDATLLFDKGRTEGSVHAQFLAFEHVGAQMWPSAIPLWLYGIQPKGIKVEGSVQLTLNVPSLSGSRDYISPDGYPYVVLLGFNLAQQVVEPIGVGRVENNQVISEGSVNLTSLDYVGYAQVLPQLAEHLASYSTGDISMQALKAKLQAVPQEEN